MVKEYIEREAAIDAMTADNLLKHFDSVEDVIEKRFHRAAERILAKIPTADVVELPCRIGDTVWCIRSFRGIDHPQETKVSGMYFTQDMRLNIQCKYVGIGEFGKKVFKTREDAMKAMEGQRA